MKDTTYEQICEKLGCEPKNIEIPFFDTEDDNWVNPFSVLTAEESYYLYENGYLDE